MVRSCMWSKPFFSFFLVAFVGLFNSLFGQKIQIELGPDEIGENQAWTITVSVNNDRLKNYDNFPDIEGFRKRGTSTQSQTSTLTAPEHLINLPWTSPMSFAPHDISAPPHRRSRRASDGDYTA